ncbi:MAG: hypothetical protein KatS3mg110_0304 [Pirellulaceae bacterium]|nr:MAG: hypothetical protein KatS3mg110_0304 [Pirellulaceae bacterium]
MGRRANELRPVKIQRRYTRTCPGSVLYRAGNTTVLCTASIDVTVPPWLQGQGKGWITAEYNMLPGSTQPRKPRERGGKIDGRTTEIQRLIGRSLRAVADLEALGERLITVDCDVLEADGGTRTAAITGGFIALVDAIDSILDQLPDPSRYPLRDSVAAVSVGLSGWAARPGPGLRTGRRCRRRYERRDDRIGAFRRNPRDRRGGYVQRRGAAGAVESGTARYRRTAPISSQSTRKTLAFLTE